MRKQKFVAIKDEGRDKGKMFQITEMPASQAEKWAMRAIMAAAHAGVKMPDNVTPGLGMQGIALLGVQALMAASYYDIEPLLDEMMACVKIVPDPSNQNVTRNLIEDDIEEIQTRVTLRSEVVKLHVDFSAAVAQPKST